MKSSGKESAKRGDFAGGTHGTRATPVWRSQGAIAWLGFLARFWLGDFAAGGQLRPGTGEAMPALAGWGYCVNLARSLAGIGLAEPIEEDIDPLGFDFLGSMGKWIKVRATNSGL